MYERAEASIPTHSICVLEASNCHIRRCALRCGELAIANDALIEHLVSSSPGCCDVNVGFNTSKACNPLTGLGTLVYVRMRAAVQAWLEGQS
jgi:hypothetical protein